MFCGVCLNGLRNFAVVPDTFLTANGNQIGSSLYVICLTFALMTRLNIAQREKDLAQQQAFRNQQIAAETQRNAVEMKLQALQAKINPHFLFNALNTIAGLIAEAPERAEGVVIKLSKLFRYTLTATEKDRVLLSEELAIVRSYLEIEQARFGDRLAFEIRQDPNIDGVTLPGLTLQPLVENCVKHGLRSKLQGGKVLVIANVDGDSCHLVVEDDGVGMAAGAGRGGHGLANVRERLQLAFGADFQMHIVSESGVRIDIRIPVR
jgi:LytS/YehU family sensor histidine kinase